MTDETLLLVRPELGFYTLAGAPESPRVLLEEMRDAERVNGHEFFPAGGQQVSLRMVMSFPRGWPWFSPAGVGVSGRGA